MEPNKEEQWPPDQTEEEEDDEDLGTEDLPGIVNPSVPLSSFHIKLSLEEIKGMSVEELRPFFKDARNVWRTANLFEETCEDPAKYPPIFSLKDEDTSSCVSLKRLYLMIEDTTEFKFAEMCLGSWEHWEMITNSWVLKPHIEKWRELLDIQLQSKYLLRIKQLSEEGDGPSSLNATKYLLELQRKGKGKEESHGRGRPSKKEKEALLQREVRDSKTIKDDAARLGLKVV